MNKFSEEKINSFDTLHLNSKINVPLVVDLDGTLVLADTLHEIAVKFLIKNPFLNLPIMIGWLFKGKAHFKHNMSQQIEVNVASLPYNMPFLKWVSSQRENGRKIVLCSAANERIANKVAEYTQIFDEVISSTKSENLSGKNKALILEEKFSDTGYIYAGNSFDDIPVWDKAIETIIVNAPNKLEKIVKKTYDQNLFFSTNVKKISIWLKPLRLHQWTKNLLIFLPLIAAHQQYNFENISLLLASFICIGLCASSTYVFNDIIDIDSDRLHARKKNRSFASGQIPVKFSLLMMLLLPLSIIFASMIGENFMMIILLYTLLTLSYSLFLKIFAIIDCIVLAALYTIRIIAGAVVIDNVPSFWLIAFSTLFFFSLAFLKRYSELLSARDLGENIIHGRGYLSSDSPLILSLWISSALGSVIVMMLYLNSPEILQLYNSPQIVWFTIPILLFWTSYIWLQANRGNMHDDPVIFAIKDRVSILSAICFFVCIILGARGF